MIILMDNTFAAIILKSISYESIDTYFMLPDIGTGIYCYWKTTRIEKLEQDQIRWSATSEGFSEGI